MSDQFRFYLNGGNNHIILTSESYTTKTACSKGIESVRINSQYNSKFRRSEAKNGSSYFNLKASNGQVIGTSEMYSSTQAMENAIVSVMENAKGAKVEDNT